MKASMNGWWHPVKLVVTFNINNQSEAEELAAVVKKYGVEGELNALNQHIKDQGDLRCGGAEFYRQPEIPALPIGTKLKE